MTITCDVTAATASTDTTEVSLGTITMPADAQSVVGIGVGSAGGAGLTTIKGTSGMFRVQCNGLDITPCKFPVAGGQQITTGVYNEPIRIWPVNWSGVANMQFTFYYTGDMALTVHNSYRGFMLFTR